MRWIGIPFDIFSQSYHNANIYLTAAANAEFRTHATPFQSDSTVEDGFLRRSPCLLHAL